MLFCAFRFTLYAFLMDSTRAIIIKIETSGEADILATVYTELFGKMTFMAKGARKMEAKLRPDLQPYSLVELSFVRGKNNLLLTGAKTIETFITRESGYKDIFAATLLTFIIDVLVVQPEKDERMFLTILASFRAITQPQFFSGTEAGQGDRKCWVIVQRFFWSMLKMSGVFVLSEKCPQCQQSFEDGAVFNFSGEILCRSCEKSSSCLLDKEDLYALQRIMDEGISGQIPEHVYEHLDKVLITFLFKEDFFVEANPVAVSWFLERVV